jgi:hypothetical protein
LNLFILLSLVLFLCSSGCEEDSTINNPNISQNGWLTVFLTDANISAFDSVNVTFTELSAHLDSSWITVLDTPRTINLLVLNNGKTIVLGNSEMTAEHYTQIRLKISESYLVQSGFRHIMKVPSGSQTGLKIGPEFTINPGSTYELVIDFDVCRSIVLTGLPSQPTSYKLKPHLRVLPKAITGSISGEISNPANIPVVAAIQNEDTVTTSLPDTLTGYFMLSFLPAGFYDVAVSDTLNQNYIQQNIEVKAGQNTDLGSITLEYNILMQ